MEQKEIVLEKVRIREIEPGIMENLLLAGVTLEAQDVLSIKEANLELAQGRPYAVLLVSEPMSTFSEEARHMAASERVAYNTAAKALLVESLGHRIIGNFYLTVHKPVIRTAVFTDREKALQWLRECLADFPIQRDDQGQ